ncbi:MAG: hypothetical protein QM796_10450 [Chthoniobacteraceae bacterium]
MKKLAVTATLFVFALSSPFCVTPSSAREKAAKPEASATPAPSATPSATPKPKKPSLLDRLNPFQHHEKKPKATPTPAASATPAPTPTAVAKSSPTPREEKRSSRKHAKAAAEATPEPTPSATPKPRRKPRPTPTPEETPAATPAPKKSDDAPTTGMNAPLPFSPEATATKPEANSSLPAGIDNEVVIKARYSAVKSQALEDKDILALQDKADAARDPDTQRSLTKAYYRALFDKMRDIDPTLKDRIDRIEAATIKRLQTTGASQDE